MLNILLISGGGGNEHHISITSCAFIREHLAHMKDFNPIQIHITEKGQWLHEAGMACEINQLGELLLFSDEKRSSLDQVINIDYVIPFMHGHPGESGHIQAMLELKNLPYLGSNCNSHQLCFNKITTKLWLEKMDIPTAPFEIYQIGTPKNKIESFFNKYKKVFIKACSEGSSFGCFPIEAQEELWPKINEALTFSPYILIEPLLSAREIEVSVFENNGEINVSSPGEILTSNQGFYSYEEKYSEESTTNTKTKADLEENIQDQIKTYALEVFRVFNLKDLARIDFFLIEDQIYLNEVNTLPGLTPISMFPKMMEESGLKFSNFLSDRIKNRKKI